MNFYFDTEFTGLHKNTSLISIGIVTNEGHTFYAEFTDYKKSQVNPWIKENVIANLILKDKPAHYYDINKENLYNDIICTTIKGTKSFIKSCIVDWMTYIKRRNYDDGQKEFYAQMISDVCHYDFVLFIDMFGTAFDLPDFISPVCVDINPLIARHNDISESQAFDINREEFCKILDTGSKKHNALHDAHVIRHCMNFINESDYNYKVMAN